MLRKMVLVGLLLLCGSSLFAAEEVAWKKMRTEIGMEEMINAVFSPDEKTIFATDANLKLIELSAETGDVIRVVPEFKGIIQFSDDGEYVYTYNFEKRKWPTGELIGKYPVPKDGFLKYDNDWNLGFKINEKAGLLIGAIYVSQEYGYPWSKSLLVYDLNTFKLIETLGLDFQYYYRVVFTNDGKYFKTGSDYNPDKTTEEDDKTIYMIWDSKTLKPIKENYEIANFKSSPDGKWLGSAGRPYVRVYDNKAFTENLSLVKIYEWMPDTNGVCMSNMLCFTPDSRFLVTKGPNCNSVENNGKNNLSKFRVWDLNKGELAYKYDMGLSTSFISISKNNKIFSWAKEGMILLNWMVPSDVKEIEQVHSIIYPNPTTGEININKLEFKYGDLKVIITDINAKEIRTLFDGYYEQQNLTFNIADLPNGMYLLKIQQNNEIKSFKVMKGE